MSREHEQKRLKEGSLSREEWVRTYLRSNLPPSESRIREPMDRACKVSLVIPVYDERDLILRPLLSLARQKRIKASDLEVLVVINNPQHTSAEILENNQNTVRLIRYINGEEEDFLARDEQEVELIAEIRGSGIKIYPIDKSSPENAFPDEEAGCGPARNRGAAEADERFLSIRRNGIIAHTDADVRLDEEYITNLIELFANDPDLIGVVGTTRPEIMEGEDPLLIKANNFQLLERVYRNLLEFSKVIPPGTETKKENNPLRKISFYGPTMAAKAYETAFAGGIPKIRSASDYEFGKEINKQGKIIKSDSLIVYQLTRLSDRIPNPNSHAHRIEKMYRRLLSNDPILVEDPYNPNATIPIMQAGTQMRDKLLADFPYINGMYEKELQKMSDERKQTDVPPEENLLAELRTIRSMLQ